MTKRNSKTPRFLKSLLATGLAATSVLSPIIAEELSKPNVLKVVRTGELCKGRWDQVKGASYYEVWVQKFGRWTYNKRDLNRSPLTSSFELNVSDERALFKVRAVDSKGTAGAYSEAVKASFQPETAREKKTVTSRRQSKTADFDPKAPAPKAPTSLFTVWTEATTIKLVWQEADGAKNYAVEELKDEKWVSIPTLKFSKPNTAVIKDHPAPGPYKFRVRSIGANGRASKPSRPTKARR